MAYDSTPHNRDRRSLGNVPDIESGGLDDRTMASGPLIYDQTPKNDLVDVNGDTEPSKIGFDFDPAELSAAAAAQNANARNAGNYSRSESSLSRDEVAAVNVNRPYYVRSEASPYLSKRQAHEDVYVTKRRHARLTAFAITVLILGACGGIGWMIWQMIQANAPKSVKQYETATIERGELLEAIDTMAIVEPVDEVSVSARVSGTVAETFVKNGDIVAEGDAILRLDNPTINEALKQAQQALDDAHEDVDTQAQRLEEANAELAAAQAAQEAAEAEEEEDDNEGEDEDSNDDSGNNSSSSSSSSNNSSSSSSSNASHSSSLSAEDKAELRSKVEEAQAKVDAASAALESANTNLYSVQSTYDNAWAQSENLTVRAPIGGTVSDLIKKKDKKKDLRVSSSTKLCIVSDNSRMRVEVEIPSEARQRVHEGLEVRLVFPDVLVTKQPEDEAKEEEEKKDEENTEEGEPAPEGGEAPAEGEEAAEEPAEGEEAAEDKAEDKKDEKEEEPEGDPEPLRLKTTISSISKDDDTSMAVMIFDRPNDDVKKGVTVDTSLILQSVPDSLLVPLQAVQTSKNGAPYLNILLDPSRAIVTRVPVQIVAQNATHAAVKADNIQAGNAAIVNDPSEVEVTENPEEDEKPPSKEKAKETKNTDKDKS